MEREGESVHVCFGERDRAWLKNVPQPSSMCVCCSPKAESLENIHTKIQWVCVCVCACVWYENSHWPTSVPREAALLQSWYPSEESTNTSDEKNRALLLDFTLHCDTCMQRQNIILQWERGEKCRDDSTLRKAELQEKAEETNQLEENKKLKEKRKRDMNSIRWERE